MAAGLLDEVIAAHGGGERWLGSKELTARASAGGFAIAAKLQRHGLHDRDARLSTDEQRVVFSSFPGHGYRGVFERGAVRVESVDGRVVRERPDARRAIRNPRRLLWWDELDLLYFGASSLWTYLAIPSIFVSQDFQLREGKPWRERGESWRTFSVIFPPEIHTHSREQVFYVGEDGLIRRHDYVAEEFGDWARSAHYWFDYRDFDGLVVARRRRVLLRRRNNRSVRHPVLVWIDVDDVVAV